MKEHSNDRDKAEQSAHQRKNRGKGRAKRVWGVIGTIVLVGVLTMAIFVGIFMTYINKSLKGHVEVDMSEYDRKVSTELYRLGTDGETWEMYQTLFSDENRIWVDIGDIPKYLQEATIAIEDKRFETHHGVDWKGTLRAITRTLTGSGTQGGSTITQQLLKNVTGDNQVTVKRKITEIYRALALEKDYSKSQILEMYLNTIYLGEQCYGVQTAARMYFHKDVKDLTLAECACLIGITNNPSMYDPLLSDWARENNRERQLTILGEMLGQEKIDQATYDAAVAEEVQFSDGYTNLGNFTEPTEDQETPEKPTVQSTANNSYYTDQVISDVAAALVEKLGLEDDAPDENGNVRTAQEKAVSKIYSSGYKIYTLQDSKLQSIAESVFENSDLVEYTDDYGKPLQAAITLLDNSTGNVVAMVGGLGAKTVDRGWNWATEPRQCGSATKPISDYAPALDDGTITAASAIDDYPVRDLDGYGAWPKNSHSGFYGLTTVWTALVESLNTCAVRVNESYGSAASYNYMVEKLGFTTLTQRDSQQSGNMGLGGYDVGVTTEEMAAAYAAIANDGVYTKPRTWLRVEDSEGNVVMENETSAHSAMKETTAYLLRDILESVITSGTGTEAYFSGMTIAGKTGTTDDNRDRYFVGFSPYYCAAVWTGYESNDELSYGMGNGSAQLWKQVMREIHADLEDKAFDSCTGLTQVTVCSDSGLLATDACTKDLRGNRVRTVTVAADTAPTATCNVHKMVDYCTEGKHIATQYCPKDKVKQVAVLDFERTEYFREGVRIGSITTDSAKNPDSMFHLIEMKRAIGLEPTPTASGGETYPEVIGCPAHAGMTPVDPDHPGGGVDDPNDPNYSPSVDDPSGGFGDANLPDDPTGGIVLPSEPPAPEDPSGGFGDAGMWAANLFNRN